MAVWAIEEALKEEVMSVESLAEAVDKLLRGPWRCCWELEHPRVQVLVGLAQLVGVEAMM